MKVFLDTNVMLDWLLNRDLCFAQEAKQIIELAENKKIILFTSSGSIYTIAYILQKTIKNSNELREALKGILGIITIQNCNQKTYLEACNNHIDDLEDSFQYETAMSNIEIEYFITGNLKDFKTVSKGILKILNPAQFLKLIL